jgi:hypothetical protein
MKVSIKDLSVGMEIKTAGIELDVYSVDGKTHLGDLKITKSGLTWSKGRASVNVKKKSWKEFIAWAEAD